MNKLTTSLLLLLLALCQTSVTPLPDLPQHYALFFAVNEYQHPQLSDLRNPIANAQAIAGILGTDYGFETEVVENPTRQEIRDKLQEYKNRFQANPGGRYPYGGQLLIFFSGHGTTEYDNGFFMPSDADPTDKPATAINYNYYQNFINTINCQHILVAIDACYSVFFDPDFKLMKDGERSFIRPGELGEEDQILLRHQERMARLFFTSDGEGDMTPDRSNFARKFQKALLAGSPDDMLTSTELYVELEKARPVPHGGDFGDDEVGSSFLFVRTRGAIDPLLADQQAWESASLSNSIAAYQRYLSGHPDGVFALSARRRIQELESEEARRQDTEAFQRALRQNSSAGYLQYLEAFPKGSFAEAARDHLDQLRREAAPLAVTPARDIPEGMVFIEGGTFEMGDTFGEGGSDEKPVHSVTVTDFYLGAKEVTMAEYDAFCTATDREKPSDRDWGRGTLPAINVSWEDAIAYCNWRSEEARLTPVYRISGSTVTANWTANGYRLPTEAEWEYAAREGGKKVRFGNGEAIADPSKINFNGSPSYKRDYSVAGEYREKTTPVGSFSANALGLFDMAGNVWEWCWDWYGENYYASSGSQDPKGPSSGTSRVVRGGSWGSYPSVCRASFRNWFNPDNRYGGLGFRLARHLP